MSEKLEVAMSLWLRCTIDTRNWSDDGQFAESSEFRFQGIGWQLHFRKWPRDYSFWLRKCSGMQPKRSIHVSTHVESSDESGRIVPLFPQEERLTKRLLGDGRWNHIWCKTEHEIERSAPGFCLHGVFKLIVVLKGVESSRGRKKCVQTSLTINPIPCSSSLSEDLAKLLDSDSNPDVDFQCGGQSTKAHSLVLSARSPVLASMLQSRWAEGATGIVKIEDMDLDALRLFVRYLYTGRLDGAPALETAAALYEAADKYQVQSLRRRCAQSLMEGLTVDNACDVLVVADRHGDNKLVEEVTAFMREKKLPSTGEHWPDFCSSHPLLAKKVLNGYVGKSTAHPSKRKHCMQLRTSRSKLQKLL